MKLNGKVAIVTGAGRGIGRTVALALAREGAQMVLASRTFSELAETLRMLGESSRAIAIPTDVSAPEQVRRLVDRGIERFDRLDLVINAAAIVGPIGRLWNCDLDRWRDTIGVNLFGTMYLCQAAVPHLIKTGRGKLINFAGGGATAPRANFSAYGTSKAAVVRLTETLAEELKPYQIDVNAIAPGMVNTRMLDEIESAGDAAGDEAATAAALRNGTTTGVSSELAAELVVFLASSQSDGLTGKLVSAAYDDWRQWDFARIHELISRPWYTLRRLDHHTLRQLGGSV